MESGVHGVESEADVCPGRRISGIRGSRWSSCGAGTGSADTLAGVADLTIPGEAPQSLPEGLLGHSTEHNQALASPAGRLRRSPGLAHFIPRTPDSDRLLVLSAAFAAVRDDENADGHCARAPFCQLGATSPSRYPHSRRIVGAAPRRMLSAASPRVHAVRTVCG